MTPLAHQLAKQLLLRPQDRQHSWVVPQNSQFLRSALEGIHCFEVTECLPLTEEIQRLAARAAKQSEEHLDAMFGSYTFLPAPKTWLEWRQPSQLAPRTALLVEQIPDEEGRPPNRARCTVFTHAMAFGAGEIVQLTAAYGTIDTLPTVKGLSGSGTALQLAMMMLLLINSPKVIGRRQHMPHAGLERKLTQSFGVGTFPLHDWTEILLEVNKPLEIDDGEPHEAHLTGKRALHFCRKHIRIRLGRLEYVSAHWRGDPAIGIKRSRYTVTP